MLLSKLNIDKAQRTDKMRIGNTSSLKNKNLEFWKNTRHRGNLAIQSSAVLMFVTWAACKPTRASVDAASGKSSLAVRSMQDCAC